MDFRPIPNWMLTSPQQPDASALRCRAWGRTGYAVFNLNSFFFPTSTLAGFNLKHPGNFNVGSPACMFLEQPDHRVLDCAQAILGLLFAATALGRSDGWEMGSGNTTEHEYAYDINMFAVVRVRATSEAKARAALVRALDAADLNVNLCDREGNLLITEASIALDGADGPSLFEVDGKEAE